MTTENCEHDWSYAPYILTSCPPKKKRICRKCGANEIIALSGSGKNDYYDTVNKFKDKK